MDDTTNDFSYESILPEITDMKELHNITDIVSELKNTNTMEQAQLSMEILYEIFWKNPAHIAVHISFLIQLLYLIEKIFAENNLTNKVEYRIIQDILSSKQAK